ncbi:MAG TPA: 4Fe-4S binding protein [Syntrophales bacterium]|nr:4Fe-4S binding protein [Syntrophales bacterium]HOS77615.1 4Fe-4S binding protein [Syntrophales bacterium]
MMKHLRRLSQGLFLLLFLWLFLKTESTGADELAYPVRIFLDADPLLFFTTALATRSLDQPFLWVLIVVVVTALLGRVFCGWICPLGTLHNLVGALKRGPVRSRPANGYRYKYYLLVFLGVSSIFTVQLSGIADPLALLVRSLSVSVHPALQVATTATFDAIYASFPAGIVGVSEWIYGGLKQIFLAFRQPLFLQSASIGGLFLGILALNLREPRFWCKYLCPLGALLGLLSRYALLDRTVSEGCDGCGACARTCQGAARPDGKETWRKAECLACMNCDDACPRNAVRFGFSRKKPVASLDLGKRRVIGSMTAGLLAAPLLRTTPLSRPAAAEPKLIRPPGALEEKEFLRRCVKCGECMKVCLTNGLQPTLLEAGIEGIWSPMLVPRIGYCEYRCTLCGQVCPTGAIRRLSLAEKAEVRIGLAMIDPGRCLPYAHARSCIVCEEVCPTPKKAIWFETAAVKTRDGQTLRVKQPRVDLELCIGCGICEAKCPVLGEPAITVSSLGESRSQDRRLLLS